MQFNISYLIIYYKLYRKSEFSLGLLLETGVIKDATLDAKEYYTKSANKGYSPSQVQLATILLREGSPEGISWLSEAARSVRQTFFLSVQHQHLTHLFHVT